MVCGEGGGGGGGGGGGQGGETTKRKNGTGGAKQLGVKNWGVRNDKR